METDEKINRERTCPICLHHWNDPTTLDNCSHIFCFECIIEWTRVKPQCPLCKCALESVKHHLQWINENDELPNWESNGQIENILELRSEYELNQIMKVSTSRQPEVEKHIIVQVAKSLMGELHSLRSLSIITYTNESVYRKAIAEIDSELDEYKQLISMINHGAKRAELFNEPAFRRIVYKKNLMPNSICPPLFNITFNKDYIKSHREAVKSHILPYMVREVTSLTKKDALDIGTYLNYFIDYFSVKISRQVVVTFLTKQGIENPHQFLNNLFHYASSGQTLKVYDQNSEYTQRRANYMGDFLPEDDDVLVLNSNSDVEVIGESNRHQAQRSTEHPFFTNNLLFMDQYLQPTTSNTIRDGEVNNDISSVYQPPTSSADGRNDPQNFMIQQVLDSYSQRINYLYKPPMASHGPRQHVETQNNTGEMASNSRRRQHNKDMAVCPVILDDSDDAVECVGIVKKQRKDRKSDDSNDDDLELMDEVNEDS